jgi:CO dehydrogenase maturation factor
VGNKIRSDKDRDFLLKQMPDFHFLAFIPFRNGIIEADLEGRPPYEKDKEGLKLVKETLEELES